MYLNIVEKLLKQKLESRGSLEKFDHIGTVQLNTGFFHEFEVGFNGELLEVFVEVEPYKIENYLQHHAVLYRDFAGSKLYLQVDKELNYVEFGNPIIKNYAEYRDTSTETKVKAEDIVERELQVGIYSK